MRNCCLAFLLGVVFYCQFAVPGLFDALALWSDHPRWWQFFTNAFLSGNCGHLLTNICGAYVAVSLFSDRMRIHFILLLFILFSALSSSFYLKFFMPPHAWLVGASGGVYSLVGFCFLWLRRERVVVGGFARLPVPEFLAVVSLLLVEVAAARFRLPQLAWPLHWIAFGLGLLSALACIAAEVVSNRLAACRAGVVRLVFLPGAMLCSLVRQMAFRARPDGQNMNLLRKQVCEGSVQFERSER